MNLRIAIASLLLSALFLAIPPVFAETAPAVFEQSVSETLDLWRDGHYEQLFERLSHRGKTSRERFVAKMRGAAVRPACCWQKMENFRVMSERRSEAVVYVKVGLEGPPGSADSSTRDFRLSNEGGIWKMQLNDILALAGLSGKKGRHGSYRNSRSF
ncbi:MAG TPA: hypothetical protein VF795_10555 [Desulfuromonadaceae bacterium]